MQRRAFFRSGERGRAMKLACASSAFDELFREGSLTQIEWIESCAREFEADGVVFDVRHFPRTDSDYLAQVKKMCADVGLTVAALEDDAFFSGDEERMQQSLAIALALGAPLLTGRLEAETASSWSSALERLGRATSLAKRANVTLAVRNAPETFAATSLDLKRVSKEADSAWLRYGLDLAALDAAAEPAALLPKTVMVWASGEASDGARLLPSFRGFVALDAGATKIANAIRIWRTAFFESMIDRT